MPDFISKIEFFVNMRKAMRSYFYLSVVMLSMQFPVSAHATDGIACAGTIKTVGIHGTDRVFLRLSSMNAGVQICALNKTLGTTFPISAEQCKLVYSTLLTAYSLNKSMSVYFDNVQNGTSCSTFTAWEVATARWVHLEN